MICKINLALAYVILGFLKVAQTFAVYVCTIKKALAWQKCEYNQKSDVIKFILKYYNANGKVTMFAPFFSANSLNCAAPPKLRVT